MGRQFESPAGEEKSQGCPPEVPPLGLKRAGAILKTVRPYLGSVAQIHLSVENEGFRARFCGNWL